MKTLVQPVLFPTNRAELAFREYHQANPEVYEQLRRMALDLKQRGRARYGIMALINVVRWHRAMTTTDPDYKICNTHAPFYARLLMEREPALAGFFELRRSVADEREESVA